MIGVGDLLGHGGGAFFLTKMDDEALPTDMPQTFLLQGADTQLADSAPLPPLPCVGPRAATPTVRPPPAP